MYGSGDAVIGVNPGDRQRGYRGSAAAHARPHPRALPDSHADLRAGARHHADARRCAAARPSISCFNRSPAPRRPTPSFGVNLAHARRGLRRRRANCGRGENVMYFETGQGSALSANAHHGVDQQTCEARAYAVARRYQPLLVNTVVGFIGPEYLYDGKQIHARGLGRPLLRQAARPADGLRCLLHQPRRGRPGRYGRAADHARRRRVQLHHGRARRRRRHAALPEHELPRRAVSAQPCWASSPRPNSKRGCERRPAESPPHHGY